MPGLILQVAQRFLRQAGLGDSDFKVINNAGYKDLTGIKRIPIARLVDPKTGAESVAVGNEAVDEANARIPGKEYMSDSEMYALFSGPVTIEEKVDGHPTIILYGGYTFFCESLQYRHTVSYDGMPFSLEGWPDYTPVYDILDGEHEPPYKRTGAPWLTRSEKVSLCNMVGAPLVPLVFQGKVEPVDVPKLADRLSGFSKGSKAEGAVIKNLAKGIFGKFINIEFAKAISDETLSPGVHPMQRKEKHTRRFDQ